MIKMIEIMDIKNFTIEEIEKMMENLNGNEAGLSYIIHDLKIWQNLAGN